MSQDSQSIDQLTHQIRRLVHAVEAIAKKLDPEFKSLNLVEREHAIARVRRNPQDPQADH